MRGDIPTLARNHHSGLNSRLRDQETITENDPTHRFQTIEGRNFSYVCAVVVGRVASSSSISAHIGRENWVSQNLSFKTFGVCF